MTIYARPSWRLVRQVLADAFVVAWAVAWWVLSRAADAAIRALADPARQVERTAGDLQRQLADAATKAADVPFVGRELKTPFDQMSTTVAGLAGSANGQITGIENAATLVGWLLFLAPVGLMLALWLPPRLAFARRAAATRRLARQPHGDELLALRALANGSMRDLSRAASDPVAAWRSRDPHALRALADVELARAGVPRPRSSRTTVG